MQFENSVEFRSKPSTSQCLTMLRRCSSMDTQAVVMPLHTIMLTNLTGHVLIMMTLQFADWRHDYALIRMNAAWMVWVAGKKIPLSIDGWRAVFLYLYSKRHSQCVRWEMTRTTKKITAWLPILRFEANIKHQPANAQLSKNYRVIGYGPYLNAIKTFD